MTKLPKLLSAPNPFYPLKPGSWKAKEGPTPRTQREHVTVYSLLPDHAVPGRPPEPVRFLLQPHRDVPLDVILLQRSHRHFDDFSLHGFAHYGQCDIFGKTVQRPKSCMPRKGSSDEGTDCGSARG